MTIKPVRHRSFRRGLKTVRFRGLVTRGRKKAPFLGRNGARRGIEPKLADFFNYSGHPRIFASLSGNFLFSLKLVQLPSTFTGLTSRCGMNLGGSP